MKKLLFLFCMMAVTLCAHAQFTTYNSVQRKFITTYELGSDGYYKRVTQKQVEMIDEVEKYYAYDKKERNLYVLTPNGNAVITLTQDEAKRYKKDKSVPQLKGEALYVAIAQHTKLIDEKYAALNEARTKHIQDSIKAREYSIAKAIADSIAAERRREAKLAQEKKAREDYRNSHNWHDVPTNNLSLYCDDCEHNFAKDTLFTIGIDQNNIYYFTEEDGHLGYTYLEGHKSQIPQRLWDYAPFKYHYEAFKDSLTLYSGDYDQLEAGLSYSYLDNYFQFLRKKAPYGFFVDWDWGTEYSCIYFNFEYMNINAKTIKYIDVYFKVTNDVGDVRKTGHFQGTGPLEQFVYGSWRWDTSGYYVAGDATKMSITKVIITYMNGTKKVLTGNLLVFE